MNQHNQDKKRNFVQENEPIQAAEETLDILYQDDSLVAVHKPAGMLVHKSPIDKRETRYAMRLLRNQLGQWVYPVHRLDKPTSGLLLFALNEDTARVLSMQFEERIIQKRYIAIVRGYTAETLEIDHALKEIAAFKSEQTKADLKDAKQAITYLARLKTFELPFNDGRFNSSRYSLVELSPKTGRKHQLRRHMKHISHPIIGDVKYGKGSHNRLFREQFGSERLLLAATNLELKHPETGKVLKLECPLEPNLAQTIEQLLKYQTET